MIKKDYLPGLKCFRCKGEAVDLHEVFGGGLRQFSIANHFQIPVCRKCHYHYQAMGDNGLEKVCAIYKIPVDDFRLCVNNKYEVNRDKYLKKVSQIFLIRTELLRA